MAWVGKFHNFSVRISGSGSRGQRPQVFFKKSLPLLSIFSLHDDYKMNDAVRKSAARSE